MIRYLTVALFLGLAGSQLVLRPPQAESLRTPPAPTTLGYGPSQALPQGLVPLQLSDLARDAEAIVLGEVRENRCAWNADRTMIWTETRILVEQRWKGAGPTEITLREPGGVIPPVGVKLSIETRYRPGERVLVFLTRDALGQVRTLGAVQGRMEVARRHGEDVVLLDRVPRHVFAGLPAREDGALPRTIPLDDLRDRVAARGRPAPEGR